MAWTFIMFKQKGYRLSVILAPSIDIRNQFEQLFLEKKFYHWKKEEGSLTF